MVEPGDLVKTLAPLSIPGGTGCLGVLTGSTAWAWQTYGDKASLIGIFEVGLAGLWLALLFLYRLSGWRWLRGLEL